MTENHPQKLSGILLPDALHDFEKKFKEQRKYYQVPGAALAVVNNEDLILASADGVRDEKTGEPVTIETLFPIGSMTKSMTAVMNAIQVEAGVFNWNTLVKDISPNFKFGNQETTDYLQVQHMIGMRSGIGVPISPYQEANNKYWDQQSASYLIRSLANAPFKAKPGEKFEYVNESFATTGYLSSLKKGVEASQLLQEYNNLMRELIFKPIGMYETCSTPISSSISDNYAASYGLDTSNGKADVMRKAPISISNINGIAPAGQVVSNALELSLYARMLLNNGVTIEGKRILSQESIDKLWSDTINAPGFPGLTHETKYGLGWEIQEVNLINPNRKIQAIAHGGILPAWITWLMVVPDTNLGLIILTNSWSGLYFIFEMAKEFLKLIYGLNLDESQFIDYCQEYKRYTEELPKQIQEKVSSYTVDREQVAPLLGNYQGGWNLDVNEDNQLLLFRTGWVYYLFPSKNGLHNYIMGGSNDNVYLNDKLHDISFSIDSASSQVTMNSKATGKVAKLV